MGKGFGFIGFGQGLGLQENYSDDDYHEQKPIAITLIVSILPITARTILVSALAGTMNMMVVGVVLAALARAAVAVVGVAVATCSRSNMASKDLQSPYYRGLNDYLYYLGGFLTIIIVRWAPKPYSYYAGPYIRRKSQVSQSQMLPLSHL